jgi:hypothetical protein
MIKTVINLTNWIPTYFALFEINGFPRVSELKVQNNVLTTTKTCGNLMFTTYKQIFSKAFCMQEINFSKDQLFFFQWSCAILKD